MGRMIMMKGIRIGTGGGREEGGVGEELFLY